MGGKMSEVKEIIKMNAGQSRIYTYEKFGGYRIYDVYVCYGEEQVYKIGVCFVNATDKTKADYGRFSGSYVSEQKLYANITKAVQKDASRVIPESIKPGDVIINASGRECTFEGSVNNALIFSADCTEHPGTEYAAVWRGAPVEKIIPWHDTKTAALQSLLTEKYGGNINGFPITNKGRPITFLFFGVMGYQEEDGYNAMRLFTENKINCKKPRNSAQYLWNKKYWEKVLQRGY